MTPQRATTPSLTSDAIAAMAAAEFVEDQEFVDAGWLMVTSLVTAERRSWLVEVLEADVIMLQLPDQRTSVRVLAEKVVMGVYEGGSGLGLL